MHEDAVYFSDMKKWSVSQMVQQEFKFTMNDLIKE